MRTVSVDFNAMTESGDVRLNLPCSRADIEEQGLGPGKWAWLSDGEVIVGARLVPDERYELVGAPDWDTVIHLDEPEADDAARVASEMAELMTRETISSPKEARLLELLAQFEHYAPPEIQRSYPGYLALLRAMSLRSMGKLELAMLAASEARADLPNSSLGSYVFLDLLRHQDLEFAVKEAMSIASHPDVPANLLSLCISILASRAEETSGESFTPIADLILEWCARLDRAPDRAEFVPAIFALADFNRGLLLLRLGRKSEGKVALQRAEQTFPPVLRQFGIGDLQEYNAHTCDVARQVRELALQLPNQRGAA